MKKLFKSIMLLMLLVSLVGCGTSGPRETLHEAATLSSIDCIITINNYYTEPSSLFNEDTIVLSEAYSSEYVEFIVEGTVYDFTYRNLDYDSDSNSFIDGEILAQIPEVTDKTIDMHTKFPDGMPFEKITWQDAQGKTYEYIITAISREGDMSEKIVCLGK